MFVSYYWVLRVNNFLDWLLNKFLSAIELCINVHINFQLSIIYKIHPNSSYTCMLTLSYLTQTLFGRWWPINENNMWNLMNKLNQQGTWGAGWTAGWQLWRGEDGGGAGMEQKGHMGMNNSVVIALRREGSRVLW